MFIQIYIFADIDNFFHRNPYNSPEEVLNKFGGHSCDIVDFVKLRAEKEPRRGDLSPDRGGRSRTAASIS